MMKKRIMAVIATSVVFYYMNSSGQKVAASSSGSASATVGNSTSQGRNATSQYSVNGGSNWGNWSCSLSASPYLSMSRLISRVWWNRASYCVIRLACLQESTIFRTI